MHRLRWQIRSQKRNRRSGIHHQFQTLLTANWGGYVHWDKNGHGTAVADAFYSAGDTITLPTESDNDYDFLGWFTAPTNGTQVTAGTKFNGEVRYYAHWKHQLNGQLGIRRLCDRRNSN